MLRLTDYGALNKEVQFYYFNFFLLRKYSWSSLVSGVRKRIPSITAV